MIIRSKLLGIIIIIVIFGGIAGTMVTGQWQTLSPGKGGGESIITIDQSTGLIAPEDISGSSSLSLISESFDIPMDILIKAFALPSDINPDIFKTQDFETVYPEFEDGQEIGNGSMKWFVALYTGLAYELESDDEDTYLLQSAVDILKKQAELSEDQVAYLDTHAIEVNFDPNEITVGLVESDSALSGEQTAEEHSEDEMTVAGKTTFADLLNWGVPEEAIEGIIGGEMPNRLTNVKDYCEGQGLSFGTIKSSLQVEVDKLK